MRRTSAPAPRSRPTRRELLERVEGPPWSAWSFERRAVTARALVTVGPGQGSRVVVVPPGAIVRVELGRDTGSEEWLAAVRPALAAAAAVRVLKAPPGPGTLRVSPAGEGRAQESIRAAVAALVAEARVSDRAAVAALVERFLSEAGL